MRNLVELLSRYMALVGGLTLTVLILLTCVSILGRGLNTFGHASFLVSLSPGFAEWLIGTGVGPINGDFELVEAGIAFSIFAFLPYAQLFRGHATVDIFTNVLPRKVQRMIGAFWEVIFTLVIFLITWRLYEGMMSKFNNGQTTFLLEFPIWWAYAASVVAAIVASFVAVYSCYAAIHEMIFRHTPRSENEGAIH